MTKRLVDHIDCDERCVIPDGVTLARVPVPRHAWSDVKVCPTCGDAFLVMPVEAAFKRLARERHPDRPSGTHDLMADLNRAREQGMKEHGDAS